ncbi:MAG TPA: ribosome maturation factor RimM [Caldimonas sp.]|nr:ribosome maturation factor RimM [Caldimonas sp.]HEX2540604.1 ribosome maturation factor RimM [Caldimonas sp.]
MATEAPDVWPADALEVGRIGEAWGLQGWFKVHPYADPPEALRAARQWYLKPPEGRPSLVAGLPPSLEIARVREHGDGLVASARGIADRDGAESLRGARVFVPRSHFPSAAEDEFYWADLIGCSVVDRQGADLGSVVGLFDTGPQSVLRVRPAGADSEERLIPFVSPYVDSVDLTVRRIVVDWGADY